MDLSKQTNDSLASASVYFDADSNFSSSSAFKTLEALSDISNISAAGSHNSTLEAKSGEQVQIQINIQQKLNASIANKVTASPIYAKSKNKLQEFRAQCSTPTHAQLMRAVDCKRGSDASPSLCIDLGTAFTKMEDDNDEMPNLIIVEENKENALPDKESGEGSTLLTSSSVEIVTVIDRNKTTEQSTVQEEPMKAKEVEHVKEVRFKENLIENRTAPLKARHSLLPARINRKSMCEPDMKNNRPSRISMAATNATQRRIPPPKTIPLIKTELTTAPNKETASKLNTRTSLLPNSLGAKRAFPYAARMSVMVKTTLNSPARKLMRRSVLPSKKVGATAALPRRSIMPTVAKEAQSSGSATTARRSMLPTMLKPINSAPQLTIPQSTPSTVQQKKEQEYVCTVCKSKFRIKSLYDAHKRSHENGTPAFVRKANSTQGSTNSINRNNTPQCKYCDKKFALVRALHIHLLEKCTKIPPSEKRKLAYTEMEHVEKAQLPSFSFSHSGNSSQASSHSSAGVSKSSSTLSATQIRANTKGKHEFL